MTAIDSLRPAELGILATSYYLPEATMTVDEWATSTFQPKTLAERLHFNGAERFHIAGETESVVEMAEAAVSELISTHGIAPPSIDLIIHVHTFRYSVLPPPLSLADHIRRTLGCQNAVAFSMAQQTCGSLLGAIDQVRGWMTIDPRINRALIFTADKVIDENARAISDGLVLSDSASAIMLQRDLDFNRFTAFQRFTNTKHNPVSPTGHREAGDPSCNGVLNHSKLGRRTLTSAGLAAAEVTLLIDVNTRLRERHQTAKLIGIDPTLLYDSNIGRTGHAFCSDFVINFSDAMKGHGRDGGLCLAIAAGDVGIYNCMILANIRATC